MNFTNLCKSVQTDKEKTVMKIEHLAIWTDDIDLVRQFYMKYFNVSCGEKYVNYYGNCRNKYDKRRQCC